MKYGVVLQTLNGMRTIRFALDSIALQTVKPTTIIVLDGGSSDGTPEFVQRYVRKHSNVLLEKVPLLDKHAASIVLLYNRAMELFGKNYDGYFFHADDCVYPKNYVERLIARMKNDGVDVASGDWGVPSALDGKKAPQGAGRMVTQKAMKALGYRFPIIYGYESWLLHKAEQLGFRIANYRDIHYELLNPLGLECWHPTVEDTPDMPQGGHMFYEWGLGMRCLAYHPLYVLFRLISDLLWNKPVPKKYAFGMAWDYFSTFWNPAVLNDRYYRPINDNKYERYMTRKQIGRIGNVLALPLRKLHANS